MVTLQCLSSLKHNWAVECNRLAQYTPRVCLWNWSELQNQLWVALCISFLTPAEHGLHVAMCCGQTKACSMAQPNLHLESQPSLVFCHRIPLWGWKGTWTKLFRDGNLHVVVPSLKSQDWSCRSTWHARLHLKSIEAVSEPIKCCRKYDVLWNYKP